MNNLAIDVEPTLAISIFPIEVKVVSTDLNISLKVK